MYPCQSQQALLADETMLTPNKNTPDPSIWAKSSALHQRALSEQEILSRHLWGGWKKRGPHPGGELGSLCCQPGAGSSHRRVKEQQSHYVMAVVSPAVCSRHLSCMPHLAFARMIWKALELQICLEQGPGLSCVLAPRCPPCVSCPRNLHIFLSCAQTPTLASEILRGPCSVSKEVLQHLRISQYLGAPCQLCHPPPPPRVGGMAK